MLQAKEQEIVL